VIEYSEMTGWAILLLPLIFVFIWLSYRRRKMKPEKHQQFHREYFTGLNYLLNDEQDKALSIFVKLVENDWETIDTHFALGKIFRKKGEIDKAIKIHQGLIARPSLPEKYRSQVLLELGYDYLGAGWFDRAEGLFKEVLIHDRNSSKARHNLILIYQQEKDWHKAIAIAKDLFGESPASVGPMISQYYCELAEIAKQKGDQTQIEHNAKQSLRYDAASVRASMLLAEVDIDRGKYKKAIKHLEQIEHQDAEFIPVILERLIDCYQRLGAPEELLKYLDEVENRQSKIFLMEMHAIVIERYKGRQAAIEYLTKKLKRRPSLRGMHRLLAYKTSDVQSGASAEGVISDRDLMTDLKSAIVQMQQKHTEYQCKHCGYQANTLYWLCPSCHSWGEIKPGEVEAA